MGLTEAIILALVQGATEFLPVSSSGHLVIMKSLLGVAETGALWEVALHLGTLLAVVLVFRRELRDVVTGFCSGLWRIAHGQAWRSAWEENSQFRMGCYLVIGTLPAAVIGLALGDLIESLFAKPLLSAIMIFVTGEILWLTRSCALMRPTGRIQLPDCLAIGLAQAVALVPGISRSGTTISAALMRGIVREDAAKFSFLLSVPAVLGAAVLFAVRRMPKIEALPSDQLAPLGLGIALAAVTGYLALHLLLRVVKAGRLHSFAYYCWAISITGVALFWASAPTR